MTTIESGCKFVIFTSMCGNRGKYFIFNGKKEGEYKEYYSNGLLDIICNYKNDKREGEYKSYYNNKQLYKICNYKNGDLEGEHKKYWANGRLYGIYNCKNGKKIEI